MYILFSIIRKLPKLNLIFLILLSSCSCHSREPEKNKPTDKNETKINDQPNEIIIFIGNPGAGKSTLCNSIFQQAIFNSGLSLGTGMTQEKQEYIYENKLYIDTPGLDDVINYERAAKEVEKALKKNNNYKIVFVLTLQEGRISAYDLVTIDIVCNAIKSSFEYGLIFNDVTKEVLNLINEEGQDKLYNYLSVLQKIPSETIILTRDENIKGKANQYFEVSSNNRKILLEFLNKIKASRIDDKSIQKIYVRDFQDKADEMQKKIRKQNS